MKRVRDDDNEREKDEEGKKSKQYWSIEAGCSNSALDSNTMLRAMFPFFFPFPFSSSSSSYPLCLSPLLFFFFFSFPYLVSFPTRNHLEVFFRSWEMLHIDIRTCMHRSSCICCTFTHSWCSSSSSSSTSLYLYRILNSLVFPDLVRTETVVVICCVLV
jgi:hypothetical protein